MTAWPYSTDLVCVQTVRIAALNMPKSQNCYTRSLILQATYLSDQTVVRNLEMGRIRKWAIHAIPVHSNFRGWFALKSQGSLTLIFTHYPQTIAIMMDWSLVLKVAELVQRIVAKITRTSVWAMVGPIGPILFVYIQWFNSGASWVKIVGSSKLQFSDRQLQISHYFRHSNISIKNHFKFS